MNRKEQSRKTRGNSQVEQAIRKIESRHRAGKEILEKCTDRSPPGLVAELAAKYRVNPDTARKLRAMAIPDVGYTKAELEQWYQQFRKADFALTISHFVKLISVPKGEFRDEMTKKAIENRWSSHRLQAEIVALRPQKRRGGRKPTVVVGEQFEAEFARVLFSWNRWLMIHLEANELIRPEVHKEIKSLQRKMAKLLKLLGPSDLQ